MQRGGINIVGTFLMSRSFRIACVARGNICVLSALSSQVQSEQETTKVDIYSAWPQGTSTTALLAMITEFLFFLVHFSVHGAAHEQNFR
jgi:hypothetical protein